MALIIPDWECSCLGSIIDALTLYRSLMLGDDLGLYLESAVMLRGLHHLFLHHLLRKKTCADTANQNK